MLRYINFLLALVTIGLFFLFFEQVEVIHSLWTGSEGQTVSMQLSLFSCTLTSDVRTGTYHNYGAYTLILLVVTSLLPIVRKKW
ncbi:hypothetical protein CIG75_18585 [Tumebacillus algifaecis]|uniref:Uncharacterized protein n=1 Tax=Tumebacillus algifaecis TaxID=1214604 RepID=A0A223D5I1_9BACL|nr:hypothetical protein CIG75_18585 [Tumebacillus algifaecis]